jgi:hypothetical protein
MEILLVIRSRFYAQLTSENGQKTMERVRYSLNLACLLTLRDETSTARMFFGRGAVMAKALGTSTEEEHRPGLHKLAKVCLPCFDLLDNRLTVVYQLSK